MIALGVNESLPLSVQQKICEEDVLGLVQTSCFCHAEPNSIFEFGRSTAEEQCLNQTFELSSTKQLPYLFGYKPRPQISHAKKLT